MQQAIARVFCIIIAAHMYKEKEVHLFINYSYIYIILSQI
jgi:hypothetical protein